MMRTKTNRYQRIQRIVYVGLSSVASIVLVWRMIILLAGNTTEAAVILGCIAVIATTRMDVYLTEKEQEMKKKSDKD